MIHLPLDYADLFGGVTEVIHCIGHNTFQTEWDTMGYGEADGGGGEGKGRGGGGGGEGGVNYNWVSHPNL